MLEEEVEAVPSLLAGIAVIVVVVVIVIIDVVVVVDWAEVVVKTGEQEEGFGSEG